MTPKEQAVIDAARALVLAMEARDKFIQKIIKGQASDPSRLLMGEFLYGPEIIFRAAVAGLEGDAPRFCAECDQKTVHHSFAEEYFQYGVEEKKVTLSAVVPLFACLACGFSYTDADGEDARHEAVCRHLEVLTPKEIAAIRVLRKWTPDELAARVGVDTPLLARWESGSLIQSKEQDRQLRSLEDRSKRG